MVRQLIGLKARLTWNGVKSDTQRRFGLPIATGLLVWAGIWLSNQYWTVGSSLRASDPAAFGEFVGWGALIAFVVWISLPVIIFPLDENLDPQQLALLPLTRNQLVAGLSASALVAPSVAVPIALLVTNGILLGGGWWMAIPASLVYLALMAIAGQLFSGSISAILKTRRGRDIATFLVLGIAALSFFAYRALSGAVSDQGLSQALTSFPILKSAWFLPPVAAQRSVLAAANGQIVEAFQYIALALAGFGLVARLWRGLLNWLLVTPQELSRPARRARKGGLASRPWGVVTTLARKELRFYVRDPRQRLVWTGTVIFVGLAVAGVVVNATGLFDVRGRPWAPLFAPIMVLFVGLPIALNLFGWERNAASYLFALPAKPRQLLLGKNLAVGLALGLETAVLALGLAWFSGQWQWLWLAVPLGLCAIACQLAVGNVVSVLTPLRLPREGTDVFAQSTEQGCLALVSQTVSFFAIGLLLVVPASAVAITVAFGSVVHPAITAAIALAWGGLFYGLSLWIAGFLLKRRLPEVLAWVQVV